jgi:hypothetical protein
VAGHPVAIVDRASGKVVRTSSGKQRPSSAFAQLQRDKVEDAEMTLPRPRPSEDLSVLQSVTASQEVHQEPNASVAHAFNEAADAPVPESILQHDKEADASVVVHDALPPVGTDEPIVIEEVQEDEDSTGLVYVPGAQPEAKEPADATIGDAATTSSSEANQKLGSRQNSGSTDAAAIDDELDRNGPRIPLGTLEDHHIDALPRPRSAQSRGGGPAVAGGAETSAVSSTGRPASAKLRPESARRTRRPDSASGSRPGTRPGSASASHHAGPPAPGANPDEVQEEYGIVMIDEAALQNSFNARQTSAAVQGDLVMEDLEDDSFIQDDPGEEV